MQIFAHRSHLENELGLLGPPHPGEILRVDILPRLDMTIAALARHLGVSRSVLSGIVNERRRVSADIADRFAQAFGPSSLYWLAIQAHYDAWHLLHAAAAGRPRIVKLVLRSRAEAVSQTGRRILPSARPPHAPGRRRASGRAVSKCA